MDSNKIFFANGDDPKMIEAFLNAQKTFKYFWRELSWEYQRIIPGLNVACVKFAFTQEVDGETVVEHMRINDVEFDGNIIKGILINSPYELTNYSNGDAVEMPFEQLSDWLFAFTDTKPKKGLAKFFNKENKPRAYGGYTIQAMRSEMSDKERISHDEAWGLDFGDFDKVLLAIGQEDHPEYLVEHPMSVNTRDQYYDFFKENPEEINQVDGLGFTYLHRAAIAGNLTSAKILLDFGADKNIKSPTNETALDYAKKLGWDHVIAALEK